MTIQAHLIVLFFQLPLTVVSARVSLNPSTSNQTKNGKNKVSFGSSKI